MADFAWVAWVIAGCAVLVTIFLGVQNLRLSKSARSDSQVHQEHGRNKDWLDVARGELLARIDAAEMKIRLDIKSGENRLERMQETLLTVRDSLARLERQTDHISQLVNFETGRLPVWMQERFADVEAAIGQLADDVGKQRPVLPDRGTNVPAQARESPGVEPAHGE